jgi:hypothetical protein
MVGSQSVSPTIVINVLNESQPSALHFFLNMQSARAKMWSVLRFYGRRVAFTCLQVVSIVFVWAPVSTSANVVERFTVSCVNLSSSKDLYPTQQSLTTFVPVSIHSLIAATRLFSVNNTKFLGLIIETNLFWRTHIDKLLLKLGTVCYVLRTLKSYMSRDVLIMIYYAYFHSILTYGIIFWGNCPYTITDYRTRLLELFAVYIIEFHVENTSNQKFLLSHSIYFQY